MGLFEANLLTMMTFSNITYHVFEGLVVVEKHTKHYDFEMTPNYSI